MSSRVIEEAHQRCQDMALKAFRKTPKMGGEDLAENFEKKLVQEIDELYNNYKMSNQNKNTIEVVHSFLLKLSILCNTILCVHRKKLF